MDSFCLNLKFLCLLQSRVPLTLSSNVVSLSWRFLNQKDSETYHFGFLRETPTPPTPNNSPTNQGETTFCLLLMAIGRCLLVLPFLILQNFMVLACAVSWPASYLILTKSLLTCTCVCKHPSSYITGFDAHSTTSQRRQWHPTPVLLPRKSHGRRSLVSCSPWGRQESDKTQQLHFHFSLSCIGEGNGNPLQRSCLENPRDGEAWWAVIYGVAQSRTRLKRLSSSRVTC